MTGFLERRRARREQVPTEIKDLLTTIGMVNNVTNVIMQLSLPGVGHGVSESRVVSGSPRRYPVKRARTTTQFLAVAIVGTDHDRDLMRTEIEKVHRAVVSTPDSPVRYSGNSPELQKWVAACLFRYYLDQYTILYGDLREEDLDVLVPKAHTLGTGVQMRHKSWPTTWAEFQAYWEQMLPEMSIAPEIKEDFEAMADLSVLEEAWGPFGRPFGRALGEHRAFMTRATLPPAFRELMDWDWTPADQRRYQKLIKRFRFVDLVLGQAGMELFYRLYLWDFRLRRKVGLPVLGRLKISDLPLRSGGHLRLPARRAERTRTSEHAA